jgi:hypothetical protein
MCNALGRCEVPADRLGAVTTLQNDGSKNRRLTLRFAATGPSPRGPPTAGNTAGLFHDVCREVGRLIVVAPPSVPLFAVLATEVSTSASHGATLIGCCFAEEGDIRPRRLARFVAGRGSCPDTTRKPTPCCAASRPLPNLGSCSLRRIRPLTPELHCGVPRELRERRPWLPESKIGMTGFACGFAIPLPPAVNHLQQPRACGRRLIA